MGESRRKKERRPSVKPTDKLPSIPTTTDRVLAARQRSFCRVLINKLLDDESSLSFSKPVLELWDKSVLGDYFEKIKRPMDLGTVRKRVAAGYNQPDSDLFDPNAFREDVRLVFLNALEFNAKGTDLARFATRFINYIDSEMISLPMPSSSGPPADSSAAAADKSSESPEKLTSAAASTDKQAEASRDKDDADDDAVGDDLDDELDADKSERADSSSGRKAAKTSRNSGSSGGDGSGGGSGGGGGGGGDSGDDRDHESDGGRRNRGGKDGEQDSSSRRGAEETNGDSGGGTADGDGGGADDDDDDESRERAERDRLLQRIAMLNKQRDAQLAELELEQSSPLSYDEISALRDEVEKLPWDTSQRVVDILRNYVDDALKDCGETDPEFVTLEFSAVETKLLRKIESFVKPNQKLQAERENLAKAELEIEVARKKLKRLSDGHGASKRKRAKKTR